MKFILVAIASVLLISSCKTPYFNSANSMRNINSTIYTKDGKELNGPTTSSLESNFRGSDYITVSEKDKKGSQRIYLTDIKYISIRGDYYEPKLVDMGFASRDKLLLLKRLTHENSKIGLYELRQQETRNQNNGSGSSSSYTVTNYSYYITPPGNDRLQAFNIEGKRLVPNFENKMSEFVNDCAPLAGKIRNKESGYFYAQISLNQQKKVEIIRGIIDEYNRCR